MVAYKLLLLPTACLALTHTAAVRPTGVATPKITRSALLSATEDPIKAAPKKAELRAATPLNVVTGASPQLMLAGLMLAVFATPGVAQAAGAAGGAATLSFGDIMAKASKKALGGGLAGTVAGVIQVITLMWMRTTMNYQYRNGGTTKEALTTLYNEGGIGRFYQGLPYALMQAPLSRFGDTAANTGVLTAFAMASPGTPLALQTAVASLSGSLWRFMITPVDTLKTTMQVEGKEAMGLLKEKIDKNGPFMLYQGGIGNAVASFVGSYPWYFTFNILQKVLPLAPEGAVALKLLRNAAAGFGATCVSDVTSNFIRVLKTTVQTSPEKISYPEAAKQIIDKEGILGLFTRGLGTRLLTNGIQASVFSVLWKVLEEQFTK